MDADETNMQGALLSVKDAATALGLRPATVTQDILRGQLTAVRLPHGHATCLFVAHAAIDRYRRASLGSQGWTNRRAALSPHGCTDGNAADIPSVTFVPDV